MASLLEATAAHARRRGGAAAAALALERAAELSPAPEDQARRLVSAASAAVTAGQGDWVRDLAARALWRRRTRNRGCGRAASPGGHWPTPAAARRRSRRSSRSRKRHRADFPALAWEALADAATVAYQAGTLDSRQAVGRVLRLLEAAGPGSRPPRPRTQPRPSAYPRKLWILACTDPSGSSGQLVPYLRQIAGTAMDEAALWRIGSAAWLLDESALAVRLLRRRWTGCGHPARRAPAAAG